MLDTGHLQFLQFKSPNWASLSLETLPFKLGNEVGSRELIFPRVVVTDLARKEQWLKLTG